MGIFKIFLIMILVAGYVRCECAHDWSPVRNSNYVRSNAIIAGNYKRNMPAYVGMGSVEHKGYIPGRVQLDRPEGLYYTHNMQVVVQRNNYDYLKQNPNNNYTWVDASSNICVDNAVTVGDFYIGRTTVNGFTYLGRVEIGQNGLNFENGNGMEVTTNRYQVLVCHENVANVEQLEVEVRNCKGELGHVTKDFEELKVKSEKCEDAARNCNESKEVLKENNQLLREKNNKLSSDLNECLRKPCSSPTVCPIVPNVNCNPIKNQLEALKIQNENLAQQSNAEIQRLNEKIQELENSLALSRSQINGCQKHCSPGAQGCMDALSKVSSLNDAEQSALLDKISELMNDEDKQKLGILKKYD